MYMTPEINVIAKTTNAGPAAAHRSISQGRRPGRRRGTRRGAHARVPCMQGESRLQNGASRRRTSCTGPAATRPCIAPAPHPCARRISRGRTRPAMGDTQLAARLGREARAWRAARAPLHLPARDPAHALFVVHHRCGGPCPACSLPCAQRLLLPHGCPCRASGSALTPHGDTNHTEMARRGGSASSSGGSSRSSSRWCPGPGACLCRAAVQSLPAVRGGPGAAAAAGLTCVHRAVRVCV